VPVNEFDDPVAAAAKHIRIYATVLAAHYRLILTTRLPPEHRSPVKAPQCLAVPRLFFER
jgi:hypothetical protein